MPSLIIDYSALLSESLGVATSPDVSSFLDGPVGTPPCPGIQPSPILLLPLITCSSAATRLSWTPPPPTLGAPYLSGFGRAENTETKKIIVIIIILLTGETSFLLRRPCGPASTGQSVVGFFFYLALLFSFFSFLFPSPHSMVLKWDVPPGRKGETQEHSAVLNLGKWTRPITSARTPFQFLTPANLEFSR